MTEQKYYNIKITVESVAGKCPLENVPGKSVYSGANRHPIPI